MLSSSSPNMTVKPLVGPKRWMISHVVILATGDPQTAVSHLGGIVLFVQMLLTKFRVRSGRINPFGGLTAS